jgi:hypothetical protein
MDIGFTEFSKNKQKVESKNKIQNLRHNIPAKFLLTFNGTTKVEESAFSANCFLIKLIVPRAQPSTLAHFSSLQTLGTFKFTAYSGIA